MVVLLTAVLGGVILSTLLKGIFDWPRPDLIVEGTHAFNASFPSGHALLSAATYLTLGALLAQIQSPFRLKAFVLLLSLFVMVIVGFSRLYLGVHWPSDILAGWTIGAIWALFCWVGAHWLQENDTPLREKPSLNQSKVGTVEPSQSSICIVFMRFFASAPAAQYKIGAAHPERHKQHRSRYRPNLKSAANFYPNKRHHQPAPGSTPLCPPG
ncbi:MAG: hypothetical protein CL608_21270 [Anaerolineaceae bacterium]|nr:hypothetical protein [Anaerolineaceae bacterium]